MNRYLYYDCTGTCSLLFFLHFMMKEVAAMDLVEKLFRLEMLFHRYQAHSFRAHGALGSPLRGQGRVLSILKLQPVISQKELSYLLNMRQQSLSELLAKLKKSGYITRKPSPEDKRATVISLTQAGREAAENVDRQEVDIQRILDCLSEEEQAQLGEYLDRLANTLEQALKEAGIEKEAPFGGRCGPGHPFAQAFGRAFGQGMRPEEGEPMRPGPGGPPDAACFGGFATWGPQAPFGPQSRPEYDSSKEDD